MSKIYVVATPIGNLEDITLRALRVLRKVPLIVCEDTREAQKILKKYEIKGNLMSYYKPKEKEKVSFILKELKRVKDIALITDSGTPVISDPGALLIREAIKEGFEIVPIPGPSAVTTALMVSGFETNSFIFGGFPPRKGKSLENFVEQILNFPGPVVIYERANRVKNFLEFVAKKDKDRMVLVAREMTKLHEEFMRGSVEDILGKIKGKELKGEITIVLEGCKKAKKKRKEPLKYILKLLYAKYKVPKPILKDLTKLY